MPLLSANTGNKSQGQGSANASDRNDAPAENATPRMLVPFVRASDENIQPGNLDRVSAVLSASAQDYGIINIPAYGYASHLWLDVNATGGAAGLNNAVAKEDAPFSILRDIALTEPNGAVIVQLNDGYQAFLAHKYGGVLHPSASDPRANPLYSAIATSGNFRFILRIPIAVSGRDAVGALANQDSAGEFKLRLKVGATTDIYSTSPDTKPTVQVTAWIGGWDQPEMQSGGVANETEPPAHGTTSFWTCQSGITVNAGQNTIVLNRKGNYLRQIIFVLRRAGTSRSNAQTDWPTETRFERDAFPARYYNDSIWRTIMFERTGYDNTIEAKNGLDNGVRFHDYMHEFDGLLGRENRDLWQPTRGSTRLEIKGSFANAGTLDVITNDIAIAQNVFL
jgi:hypothetical protein